MDNINRLEQSLEDARQYVCEVELEMNEQEDKIAELELEIEDKDQEILDLRIQLSAIRTMPEQLKTIAQTLQDNMPSWLHEMQDADYETEYKTGEERIIKCATKH